MRHQQLEQKLVHLSTGWSQNSGWEENPGRWRSRHVVLRSAVVIGVGLRRLLKARSWGSQSFASCESNPVLHTLILLCNIDIPITKKINVSRTGIGSPFWFQQQQLLWSWKCFIDRWIWFLLVLISTFHTHVSKWLIYDCFGDLSRVYPTGFCHHLYGFVSQMAFYHTAFFCVRMTASFFLTWTCQDFLVWTLQRTTPLSLTSLFM